MSSRRRLEKEARRLIDEIFLDPELLSGTSLRARHRARWIFVDLEEANDEIVLIRFAIVRHPRPYAFSPQHHEVLEVWRYEPRTRRLERERGLNITRERGLDSAD
ncbi:MAG TPA: hypothetical protein VK116_19305 [Planctomycetota bacterium]|nr:hypothetical protein [Planctomycetota bacterium]